MRTLLAVLPLVALGACSLGDGSSSSADGGASRSPSGDASTSQTPSQAPSATPSQDPGEGNQPDASDTDACAEVRAGIDDFNAGDLEGTVVHFKKAVPLARSQAANADSKGARDLLAAVVYYAGLAPGDYPSAAATSPQFAKYKVITLGQCVAPGLNSPQGPARSPSGQSV